MIDSTVASPMLYRPIEHGYDIVIHSATKYLNGHSDVVAGAVAASNEWIRDIKKRLDHLGGSLDPQACYLLDRGLKTLPLRMDRQCKTAAQLAARLSEHDGVKHVYHPSLSSHPEYARAQELLGGRAGLVTFETTKPAAEVLEGMHMIVTGPSLGGVESSATCPALTSHSGMKAAEREALGITDNLLRLSVGLEDIEDIWADLMRSI